MQKAKIRVLYVIDKMIRAGAQNHLQQVITGLDPRGFKPFLCCLLYKGPLAKELEDMGYPVESLHLDNIMGLNFFRAIRGLSGLIRSHRIDLVHGYLFAANIVTPPAGFISRIPVITSRRDTGFWKKSRHILSHRVVNSITARITVITDGIAVSGVSRFQIFFQQGNITLPHRRSIGPVSDAVSITDIDMLRGRPVLRAS